MTTILLFKLFIGLVAFFIFFLCQFVLLRVLDKVLGVDFKQAFRTIQKCPKSMSHYYGLRFLGTAIALGLIVCIAFVV